MQTQNVLDPAIYGTRQAPTMALPKSLPLSSLSKDAQAVFAKWPDYVKALGRKPSACYIDKKQAEKINKSLRRKYGQSVSVTDFKYDGLEIKVTE